MDLQALRKILIRLEDTIIFALIERAQFAHNECIYQAGHDEFTQLHSVSFMEYLLRELESVHARARRYTSPDEHPFTPSGDLPEPILPAINYGDDMQLHGRHKQLINVNHLIKTQYI